MKKQLEDYMIHYKLAIPEDLCNNTLLDLQTVKWNQHNFYNPNKKEYYSNSNEPEFTYDQTTSTKNIMDIIWKYVEQYVLKDLNFPWWNSWQGFNSLKFNRYTTDNLMTEHCDHIHDMFDGNRKGIPILSIIGLLNSEFTGGELILLEDREINLQKGDIVIFPSLFLYPHRVNQVTHGTRYSFASWVW